MSGFSFIHASDLHLGRRFGNIRQAEDAPLRGRLTEARFAKIDALAQAARDQGAADILLAGDTFDSATPSADLIAQTVGAWNQHSDMRWWILPGNHDNLRDAEPLWDRLAAAGLANLRLLQSARPADLAPGVALLPSPVTHRDPGRDLTADMAAMATPHGTIRIGLGHGGVVDFEDRGAHIPPDRDQSAGLDYLALGDWHGRLAVGPRVQYSGSPEQDRFKHDRRGMCLGVRLAGAGAVPQITQIDTGDFLWTDRPLAVLPGQDGAADLARLAPEQGRRNILLRISVTGRSTLAERAALTRAGDRLAPDFAFFDLITDQLETEIDAGDLDRIAASGALRQAAEALRTEATDPARAEAEREIARAALNRLFAVTTRAAS